MSERPEAAYAAGKAFGSWHKDSGPGRDELEAASRQAAEDVPARGLDGLGRRVRARRTELGLSQRELTRRAGVAQPYARYWETGKRRPSTGQLRRLAAALNTTPADLLGEPPADTQPYGRGGAVRPGSPRTLHATRKSAVQGPPGPATWGGRVLRSGPGLRTARQAEFPFNKEP